MIICELSKLKVGRCSEIIEGTENEKLNVTARMVYVKTRQHRKRVIGAIHSLQKDSVVPKVVISSC